MNRKMKPIAHSIGVLNSIEPPHIVAIHEKIFTPGRHRDDHRRGDEIGLRVDDMPTVYMWCAHTTKPMKPIATMA